MEQHLVVGRIGELTPLDKKGIAKARFDKRHGFHQSPRPITVTKEDVDEVIYNEAGPEYLGQPLLWLGKTVATLLPATKSHPYNQRIVGHVMAVIRVDSIRMPTAHKAGGIMSTVSLQITYHSSNQAGTRHGIAMQVSRAPAEVELLPTEVAES